MATKKKAAPATKRAAAAARVKREPAITVAAIASVIVVLASVFGVVLDLNTVQTVIVVVIQMLAAFGIRAKVTPV